MSFPFEPAASQPSGASFRRLAAGLAGLAVLGCGQTAPSLADVAGSVTLDGKPVSNVMVEFQPVNGGGSPSIGYTDLDGVYRLRFTRERWGALPGTHLVRIDFDLESHDRRPGLPIPAKYNRDSTLRRELRPGHNHLMFDLCSCSGPGEAPASHLAR